MDLPKEIDDYIKEIIDESLGLPASVNTLQLKLSASVDAHRRLRDQYFSALEKLRHKDELITRHKAEASMNAVSLKKFVEENQRLAAECAKLVEECSNWERECLLYDNDLEALRDFGNEADERASEAEIQVHELEEDLGRVMDELEYYKHEVEKRGVESSAESTCAEENLLDSVLSTLVSKEDIESGHTFLVANSSSESCKKLLELWNRSRPSTQNIIALVAKVRALQNDMEHLKVNLTRAEEEAKLLFEENNILNEENKKLLQIYRRQRKLDGSDGKHSSSASSKRSRRKSSPKKSIPLEKKTIDFEEVDSVRRPLSPLDNSHDCRLSNN